MEALQRAFGGSQLLNVNKDEDNLSTYSEEIYPDLENEEAVWKEGTGSEDVLNREEIGLYNSFGLGLGVDATDPKPWATNKNAFQARQVVFEDLFGIKEGILRKFNDKVTSMHEFQSSVKASVPTNKLLNVGIDTEGFRSYRAQKRSIGKEIITRTITFKSTFKDVPRVEGDFGDHEPSFESMLMEFIEEQTNATSVESLRLNVLTDYCFRFVEHSSVTHYVHGIVLGASHFRTMTEEEYMNRFGANARLGVDRIADMALKSHLKFGTRKSQSVATKIGRTKKRGQTQEEEVEEEGLIRVKLKSISSLIVNSGKLRKAMVMALSRYIHKKQDREFGPFHISCGGIFLKVDRESHNQLTATSHLTDASLFSIIRCDDEEEHFSIVYKPPISPEAEMAPPSLFLCTSKHDVPLLMKDTVSKSQLSLCSRYTESCEGPASIEEWIRGGDYYYIACPEVSGLMHRRYLCVTKPQSDSSSDSEYVTVCKYRKDNDKPDTHMVFSLIKPSKEEAHSESEMVAEECTSPVRRKVQEISGLTDSSKQPTHQMSKGPFFVATSFGSGEENVYLSVSDHNIHATADKTEASQFYFKCKPGNQFIMRTRNISRSVSQTNSREWHHSPERHLSMSVPTDLEASTLSYSYLTACKQKSESSEKLEETNREKWFDESEAFYVMDRCSSTLALSTCSQCNHGSSSSLHPPPDRRERAASASRVEDSYFCVQRTIDNFGCISQVTYTTGSLPSIHVEDHNMKERSMLFKVIKASETGTEDEEARNIMIKIV